MAAATMRCRSPRRFDCIRTGPRPSSPIRAASRTKPPSARLAIPSGQYDDRDLKLTDQLLAELDQRYRTNPATTYAAGFSNGGHFVLLLRAERSAMFAAHAVVGSVQPGYAPAAAPAPLLYLFGSGETVAIRTPGDRRSRHWSGTTVPAARCRDVLGCCKLQMPERGGAPLVFGLYNAGHIWPSDGNAWLKAFLSDPRFRDASNRNDAVPEDRADRESAAARDDASPGN